MNRLKRVCKNCADYDADNGVCTIRFTILVDKTVIPMERKPSQTGCKVFMYPYKF